MNALPRPVIDTMADRAMRMHHMRWHVSRNEWAGMTPAQQQEFRAHGWDPPRPALTGGADPRPEPDNGSGEDFLYMHRQMIADVDAILARLADPQYPRVEGWPSIPAPGDAAFPVPPPFEVPDDPDTTRAIDDAKGAASFERIRQWQAEYTDLSALRGMTLGQLGARIESNCFSSASKPVHTSRMISSHRVSMPPVKTARLYLVTKSKWICRLWTT